MRSTRRRSWSVTRRSTRWARRSSSSTTRSPVRPSKTRSARRTLYGRARKRSTRMKHDDKDDQPATASEKMKRKAYEAELETLQAELVKLQLWVVEKKLKVCIVFEGRDTAGKGGTIKAITERVSPRVF